MLQTGIHSFRLNPPFTCYPHGCGNCYVVPFWQKQKQAMVEDPYRELFRPS